MKLSGTLSARGAESTATLLSYPVSLTSLFLRFDWLSLPTVVFIMAARGTVTILNPTGNIGFRSSLAIAKETGRPAAS